MSSTRYTVVLHRSAAKDLRRIPDEMLDRLYAAMKDLSRDPYPSGCRKLHNAEDHFRIRIGDYRIVYEVRNKELVILIVRVRHRKDVYRGR